MAHLDIAMGNLCLPVGHFSFVELRQYWVSVNRILKAITFMGVPIVTPHQVASWSTKSYPLALRGEAVDTALLDRFFKRLIYGPIFSCDICLEAALGFDAVSRILNLLPSFITVHGSCL